MSGKAFPPRLHVLLARGAPYGVVIRRGPSRWACTTGWNRADDTFAVGQWVRARIYERRCDLSPDGRHLIYFAMNGRWTADLRGSWTAISRAPHLKAIGLWAKGDCWQGGGLFLNDRDVWINGCGCHDERLRPADLRVVDTPPVGGAYGAECPGVYYRRLQRDGWTLVRTRQYVATGQIDTFEKPAGGSWILRKLAHSCPPHRPGCGCYYDEHELENRAAGSHVLLPDWQWADVDSDRERLVWAQEGRLLAGRLSADGPADIRVLHDFNGMAPDPAPAPY